MITRQILSLSGNFLVNLTRLVILVLLLISSLNSYAVRLGNLYNASIAVPSQEKNDRSQGFQRALEQTLVRLTGDESLIESSELKKDFGSAEGYVLSFGYRENPEYASYLLELANRDALQLNSDDSSIDVPPIHSEKDQFNQESQSQPIDDLANQQDMLEPLVQPDSFLLDVVFAEAALNKRMQQLSLPIWGRSRPSILVWLIKSDLQGERSVIGSSELDSVLPNIKKQAEIRGVPLYFPVADLTDLSLLDVDGLWGMFSDSHIEASRRYQADSVAILRLRSTLPTADIETETTLQDESQVQWGADWQLFIAGQTYFGELNTGNVDELSDFFVTHIARETSRHYAIVGNETSDALSIEVIGANNFDDYVSIQRYLSELAPVLSISMTSAVGDKLSFDIELRDSRDMFFQHMSLGNKMLKLDDPFSELVDQDVFLEPVQKFMWQPGN